jgi:hypothetical protein
VAENKPCEVPSKNVFLATMMRNKTTTDVSNESTSDASCTGAATSGCRTLATRSAQAWRELLSAAQVRGFHGSVAIEAVVQDGTIQHIRRRFERLEK